MSAMGRLVGEIADGILHRAVTSKSGHPLAELIAEWIVGPGRDAVLTALSSTPPGTSPTRTPPASAMTVICRALADEGVESPINHGATADRIIAALTDAGLAPLDEPVTLASDVAQLRSDLGTLASMVRILRFPVPVSLDVLDSIVERSIR